MSDKLEPAIYEEHKDAREYKQSGTWKWALGLITLVLAMVGFQRWSSASRMAEIKAAIDADLDALSEDAEVINAFRQKLEDWIVEVAGSEPETRADPDFDLASLHGASGLYLRIHGDSIPARGAERDLEIRDSALTMGPDAIGRCLGINPLSMRSVYERIEFLQPVWREHAMASETVLQLEVFVDELARRTDRDLPILHDVIEADYFMLTIQRGESRHDSPVDVYIWDLESERIMLQGRVQSRGTFIRAHTTYSEGGRTQPLERRSGVADCSIASSIRTIAGGGAGEVNTELPDATRPLRTPEESEESEDNSAEDSSDEDTVETPEGAEGDDSPPEPSEVAAPAADEA